MSIDPGTKQRQQKKVIRRSPRISDWANEEEKRETDKAFTCDQFNDLNDQQIVT